MDGGNERCVAITFCFKAGLSATEALVLVQKAYGNEALNRLNVFRWYSQFRDGRELLENDERCGRPESTRSEVNIAAVVDLVKNYRQIASRMIAESLNIPKTVVLRILKEDLGKRKLCARWFHTLNTWAKGRSSHILPRHYRDGRCRQHFLTKLLRGINPLNPELNPMCCFQALLGAHHFLHVSRIRVKSLTLRRLMSYIYIYGAPILDVSRSHTTTQHSR